MLRDLGAPELIIILVIVMVIFGAGKLPGIGKALGSSIREFKKAKDGVGEPFDKLNKAVHASQASDKVGS